MTKVKFLATIEAESIEDLFQKLDMAMDLIVNGWTTHEHGWALVGDMDAIETELKERWPTIEG